MVLGLAVVLALVVGVASTALAANGQPFLLGKLTNTATAITRLSANIAGPALQVNNTSTAPAATALNLNVASGKPPMTVSATAGKATNLNADKVDGKDSTAFVTGPGDLTFVDERFSDPDGLGGAKGFSNPVAVPGAQIQAACLVQSGGSEMFLNRTSDVSTLSLWRDDGGANPISNTLSNDPSNPSNSTDSSPVSAADHVIWHGSSAAGKFTAVLFTRFEGGGSCHLSGYVLSN